MFRSAKFALCFPLSLLFFVYNSHGDVSPDAVVFSSGAGGVEVTARDLSHYIEENIPPDKRDAVLARPDIYREMAESLYVMRTLANEAQSATGFDHDQAAWAAKMYYQRRMVAELRIAYVKEKLVGANWDASALELYKVDSERFQTPEKVRASHILITVEKRTDEEAKALAAELRNKAVAGEDFSKLAAKYSEDPSAKSNNGDLGFFEFGSMVQPFSKAAFALEQTGDLSEVVKSQFGYHVIKLEERKPGGTVPFEEVKTELIDEMQTQLTNRIWQDKVIQIRSSVDIKAEDELLGKIAAQYK